MHNALPATVGGRYMGVARKGAGNYLVGQLSFQLTKRLALLGQFETMSIYGGSTAFLFDDMPSAGIPREVFALPDYPTYYVENTISNYTNYYSYRRTILIGVGHDLLLRKHWYLRIAALGGVNSLRPLGQPLLLKAKGSNYYQSVNYVPEQSMGFAANAELMLGYRWRIKQRQEIRFSFDQALTYNELSVDYSIQTTDLTGKNSQTRTQEPFSLWLRRVGFSVQYGF